MKPENGEKTTREGKAYSPRISKELYAQVEEKLNLRKAISSRENSMTWKRIAKSQWAGEEK